MTKPKDPLPSRFDKDAHYRIVVEGVIPESWHGRLAGMKVISSQPEQHGHRSVLQGDIKDQTELNGILESLYRLQVILISIEKQEDKQ